MMRESLLDAYALAWANGATKAIAAHWSPADFRFYKAEEISEPFCDWPTTLAYWQANEAMHENVALSFSAITPLPLSGDFSLLMAQMRWDIRFSTAAPPHLAGKAMGGDNHVLVLLAGELIAGWCEAPEAATVYVRRLFEQSARI
jgi:hypothetical protein